MERGMSSEHKALAAAEAGEAVVEEMGYD